ncbi:MAG TPA: alpha/beta hydrolase family protein [Pirellulales bacterium]|nr:alpha/beta hydrolase family protein [Pirellulales bacterium]
MSCRNQVLVFGAAVCAAAFFYSPPLQAGDTEIRTGDVRFVPTPDEPTVPELFRLEAHQFSFRQEPLPTVSKSMTISQLTFPSPVETPHMVNNTVHCEYFRPTSAGKHPATVVLHILGGDFELSRLFCRNLAQHGVAALFLKLPYYGPRRPAEGRVRMVSEDPRQTVEGMRQAILDIRRGAAWLAAQQEVDPEQLGVFGISLGGITSALAATAEPRFHKACLMLAGGDIGQVAWDDPKLTRLRQKWIDEGGTKDEFIRLWKSIDPVTYADRVRKRKTKILMLNARQDEIIPPICTESLWRAFGEPEIVWYDAGHVSAAKYIFDGLGRVSRFFQPESDEARQPPAAAKEAE